MTGLPTSLDQPVLSYVEVRQRFDSAEGSHLAVRHVDLTIAKGEVICIVGPSGCGKSTLLNMAAGLLRPTAGSVLFEGQPLSRINHRVGYVTQNDSLLPWRTVARNVALPLEVSSCTRKERRRRVAEVLETVGLAHCASRYPSQLSGGMRKRVGLAQTLVYNPSTILMDEPFGALDAQLRLDLQQELLRLVDERELTVLFVTHDLEEAILMADRVILFSASPGRIVADRRIPFARPRDLATLRRDPRVGTIWADLWNLLERPARSGGETSLPLVEVQPVGTP
jgi:NitT/TauT family transport system ATP-binding protein